MVYLPCRCIIILPLVNKRCFLLPGASAKSVFRYHVTESDLMSVMAVESDPRSCVLYGYLNRTPIKPPASEPILKKWLVHQYYHPVRWLKVHYLPDRPVPMYQHLPVEHLHLCTVTPWHIFDQDTNHVLLPSWSIEATFRLTVTVSVAVSVAVSGSIIIFLLIWWWSGIAYSRNTSNR